MYAVGLALAGRRPTFPKRHTTGFDIYFPPPPEDDWGHSHRQEGRVCASRGMSYRRMENRVSRREGRAGEIGQQARSGSGQHEGRVSRTDGTGQQEGRDGSAGREVVSGRDGAGQLDTRTGQQEEKGQPEGVPRGQEGAHTRAGTADVRTEQANTSGQTGATKRGRTMARRVASSPSTRRTGRRFVASLRDAAHVSYATR